MSTTLVKSPAAIKHYILTLQDHLHNYQQLVSKNQHLQSDIMRAKSFFQYIVQQIENAISQIALFTRISSYQDDNTQNQFYQLLDAIIESLQEFYDRYQEKYLDRMFDIDEFVHTCGATEYYFPRLNRLYIEASAIATRIIINELN
jgi:hypothetical protein